MNAVEKVSNFVGKTFSLWVILFACLGFFAPGLFTGYKNAISPLLGIVMFGMGLTLSTADFREVFRRPKDVAIGVVGHYLIMPTIAYVLASAKALPLVSTIAIVLIVAIVVGLNQPKIMSNGLLIFVAVILHNLIGYLLGYFFAKLFGMDLSKRKAVTLETGMQNSGLGAALAAAHFSPLAAVPSALFSVWHNLSGSMLATWFVRRTEGKK